MKVGIVSFFKSVNYGAVLQALALQKCLYKLGIDSLYIDNSLFVIPEQCTIFQKIYYCIRNYLGYGKRKKTTLSFIEKHIKSSFPVRNESDLLEIENQFEVFIAGSDQIWNPIFQKKYYNFFLLQFIQNKKKISFATSFGVWHLPSDIEELYRISLKDFSSISCREKTGVNIVETLGIKAEQVIDPTLLLSHYEWRHYMEKEPIVKEKYILYYSLPGHGEVNNYSLRLVKWLLKYKFKGYKAIVIGDREYKLYSKPFYSIRSAGPQDFLNLVSFASYVVTNSFHGVCFSINFKKSFNCALDPNNGLSSRIIDLLNDFNLSDRICEVNQPIEEQNFTEINYKEPMGILEKKREYAISYLKKHLIK